MSDETKLNACKECKAIPSTEHNSYGDVRFNCVAGHNKDGNWFGRESNALADWNEMHPTTPPEQERGEVCPECGEKMLKYCEIDGVISSYTHTCNGTGFIIKKGSKQCCERDHDHDGNCDRHKAQAEAVTAPTPEQVEELENSIASAIKLATDPVKSIVHMFKWRLASRDSEVERLKAAIRLKDNVLGMCFEEWFDIEGNMTLKPDRNFYAKLRSRTVEAIHASDQTALDKVPFILSLIERNTKLEQRVKELEGNRPKIVCICGSSRFVGESAVKAWELQKQGIATFSMTLLPSWYTGLLHHQAEAEGVAEILDALFLKLIDMADEIFVMNLPIPGHENGYIGQRTSVEIKHALSKGKPVRYIHNSALKPADEKGKV